MIKQFLLIAIAAVMLSACGGSSDSGGTPDWSNVSSLPSSSQASSEESSAPPSIDMSYSFEEGIDGWYINGAADTETVKTTEIELAHNMVESTLEFIPIDWSQVTNKNWIYQARMDFGETIDLTDSHIEFIVSIPDAYATDAGLGLQIIVHAVDTANTDYATNILLSSLTKNSDGDYVIGRDTSLTTAVGFGFQVSKAPADAALKESIHIKSVLIKLPVGSGSGGSSSSAAGANTINIPMDSTWRGNSGGTTAYSADGVVFTATASGQGAVYDYAGPVNWEGATLSFVINVSQAYKDSGADLQPFAQEKDNWDGLWCDIANADLIADDDQIVSCGPLGATFNVSDAAGIQAGLQAPGSVNGSIIIKSATVTLAE